jgi:hypothetical protein
MNFAIHARIVGSAFIALSACGARAGEPCVPHWDPNIGAPGPNGLVLDSIFESNGNAIVGGAFSGIGALTAPHVARWDGAQWSVLGSGLDGTVEALTMFAGDPYAGGAFQFSGGFAATRVARWDGAAWSDIGGGVDNKVFALGVSSVGGSPMLYAGGLFLSAGGAPAKRIASWDGAAWSALGSGVTIPGMASVVYTVVEFDLGSGPLLAVGGVFTVAGGQPASNIAIWDGSAWSPLGGGVDGAVRCLAAHDDGSGPALYVGGAFDTAGGIASKRVARWDGASWSSVGGSGSWGIGSTVRSLAVFDEGDGPRLIAGGDFLKANDVVVQRLASWDGALWSPVFGGADSMVLSLRTGQEGSEPAILVGGSFSLAGGVPSLSAAMHVGCVATGPVGDLNGDGAVDTADLGLLIGNFGSNNPATDINQDGIVDTADLGLLISNFGA